ncbi:uncharacterized protein LOC100142172 isoform X1 [Tribolium castaneum]|uniref:PH domain-containing protein n=1 Tax=Tribolium castaneum TaxID=7070 RepID=D6WKV8_TRICA|nr:PREDICTED: uncharacterized protein LOC100142172 isoform X1 [Tribolium castaneum]EFA04025.2 hypothetical protein TcasGA2_TC014254 [Tribolium castaneum]|eukprot:XP_001813445.1 PREDICTED: uncharacterized protein LOC100142172 isoform X1 [Tribolium castaneum]
MLVETDADSGPPERPAGVLDSPILARVERVLLRHEEGLERDRRYFPRPEYTQSLLSSSFGKESTATVKRGLLWQQRKKLFSRWKERYFILTRDYLYCFQRASGADRISEMGQFLFKVKLVDIERVEWENKKTYSIVALVLGRDGKIFLRTPDGLEDWFELIEECMLMSKERRKALRHSHDGKPRDNNNITGSLGEWMLPHHKLPLRQLPTDSVRQDVIRRREWTPSEKDWEHPTLDNRLSLLTDIDINTYDDSTLEAPSITSYRMNQDVLCIQPPSLRGMGSFRSTRETSNFSKRNVPNIQDIPFIKFRERSYSDIQREDRRVWRGLPNDNRKLH